MRQISERKKVLERVLIILLLLPVLLFVYFVATGNYYPFYADEAIYLTGGKLFYETWSLKAVLAFDEMRSKVGDFGWYGPMYNVLYGLFPKVFGWSAVSNLWVHLLLYGIVIYIIGISKLLPPMNKKVLLVCFLGSYTFIPFLFSYFPELLHVLFGLLLYVYYMRAHENPRSFWVFVLLVMCFTLFRVTYIFSLLALLPLRIAGLSQLKKIGVVAMGFMLGLLYFAFFHAKPSVVGLGDVFAFDLHYAAIVFKTVKTNLHSNLLLFIGFFKTWTKGFESLLGMVFLGCLLLHSTFKNKGIQRRRGVGLLITCIVLISVLLSLYSAKIFFMEKQLTWLYTFLLLVIINEQRYNKIVVSIYLVFFLPFMVYKTYDTIMKRTESYRITNKQKEMLPEIEGFVGKLENKKQVTHILFADHDQPILNNLAYSFFPLSINGNPILYTTNYRISHPDEKYKEHGRQHIDYILAREQINKSGWQLKAILKEGYYLYEKKGKP